MAPVPDFADKAYLLTHYKQLLQVSHEKKN